ncbi:MAG: M1 family metallopeptidase, partial [Acidimicrobiales bacterium]
FIVGPLELTDPVDVDGTPLRIAHPPGKGHLTAYALDIGAFSLRFFSDYYGIPYPGDKLDLVAFIVGPLEVTDPVDVDGVPLRIACPPGKTGLTAYALDVGTACLRYFTDYYGIAYPGGKLDLVAIPDFAFGAMENLGCVTFREVLLLVDPAKAAQPELLNITDVINHEIAHMWFGDLVTMKWWNGIWLNEAFATFMEMKATESFRPDWNRWVEFGLSRSAAFDTDALDSTRPIEFTVTSPEEAEGMFDVLTYEKGGAVLRMLEQYLGEDVFRDGVRRYLADHEYGNTETTDLWDSIEAATVSSGLGDQPVRRIMDSWIFQGGHPIVSADLVAATTLRLTQERFRLSAAAEPDAPAASEGLGDVWSVPVVLTVSTDGRVRSERVLLDEREVDVDLGAAPDYVVVNAGGHGFYRVRYSAKLRDALITHGIGNLDVLERYGILDDAWASVVAGSTSSGEFLDLVRAYADEADVSVWKRLAGALDELDRVLPDANRDDLRARVRALAGPALRRLG